MVFVSAWLKTHEVEKKVDGDEAGKAATEVKRGITRLRERTGKFLRADKNGEPVTPVDFLNLWS